MVPKFAVSKGLLSEAMTYRLYEPSGMSVHARYDEVASVALYARILKYTGGNPLGPDPFLISLTNGSLVQRFGSPTMKYMSPLLASVNPSINM